MRNVTLKPGQDIRVKYGGKSVVLGVGNRYDREASGEPQDFLFYMTDDNASGMHTTRTVKVAYEANDLLWDTSEKKEWNDGSGFE